MARNLDYDYRDRLLNFIKLEWLKNGQEPIRLTTDDLAEGMGDGNRNKAFYYSKILERSGNLKIIRGVGSQANIYSFLNDNTADRLTEAKEEMVNNIDDLVSQLNNFPTQMINLFSEITRQNTELQGELEHYKQLFGELIFDGTDSNGYPRYKTKPHSLLAATLEQINRNNTCVVE